MTVANRSIGTESVLQRPRLGSRISTSVADGCCAVVALACFVLHLPMIILFVAICAAAWLLRER